MATSAPIIVFGPTGAVGSHTALTAYEHYSSSTSSTTSTNDETTSAPRIILAMRDPSKTIPLLPSSPIFHRVRADLTDAASVSSAIQSTGAKRAFVYLVHPSSDHLQSSLTAMKDAGIEIVVFLSSFTINTRDLDEMKRIGRSEVIPYLHAQVEVNLHEIFGPNGYVAVRPGGFASNSMAWKQGIKEGVVELYGPEVLLDFIVAKDMGRVCGRILVGGAPDDNNVVYLYGHELLTQHDAVGVVAKVLGRDIKVKEISKDEFVTSMVKQGRPDVFAKYMIKLYEEIDSGKQTELDIGQKNISKYGGQPATHFEEWVQENRNLFES